MPTRTELLHSNVYLLLQDQKRVTDLFADWTANANVQRRESVRSVMTSVLRQLQRDLDRIYVLAQGYSFPTAQEAGSGGEAEGGEATNGSRALSSRSVEEGTSPTPSLVGIFLRGYQALNELESRYESAYCVAAALDESPIANVAHSNLEALRRQRKEFRELWPRVTASRGNSAHGSGASRARPPRPGRFAESRGPNEA